MDSPFPTLNLLFLTSSVGRQLFSVLPPDTLLLHYLVRIEYLFTCQPPPLDSKLHEKRALLYLIYLLHTPQSLAPKRCLLNICGMGLN